MNSNNNLSINLNLNLFILDSYHQQMTNTIKWFNDEYRS
jgi:hypothetical protein